MLAVLGCWDIQKFRGAIDSTSTQCIHTYNLQMKVPVVLCQKSSISLHQHTFLGYLFEGLIPTPPSVMCTYIYSIHFSFEHFSRISFGIIFERGKCLGFLFSIFRNSYDLNDIFAGSFILLLVLCCSFDAGWREGISSQKWGKSCWHEGWIRLKLFNWRQLSAFVCHYVAVGLNWCWFYVFSWIRFLITIGLRVWVTH